MKIKIILYFGQGQTFVFKKSGINEENKNEALEVENRGSSESKRKVLFDKTLLSEIQRLFSVFPLILFSKRSKFSIYPWKTKLFSFMFVISSLNF